MSGYERETQKPKTRDAGGGGEVRCVWGEVIELSSPEMSFDPRGLTKWSGQGQHRTNTGDGWTEAGMMGEREGRLFGLMVRQDHSER